MKVALIGGHLAPALAVLDALPKNWEVVFFGRVNVFEGDKTFSLEYQTITKRGIQFLPVTAARIQRKVTSHTLTSFYKLPKGYVKALLDLQKEKPDVVLSFGGYLSLPVCFAAKTLSIPIVIHEQTLEAGMANKIVAKFANKICLSWESSKEFFPKEKTVLTGNPLREYEQKEMDLFSKDDTRLPFLYITGGSGGSHFLNLLVEGMLPNILNKFRIYHQTGDTKQFKDFERLSSLKETFPTAQKTRYVLTKFISPSLVGIVMQNATLVLSRSGINTVTELLQFAKPAVLLPLPHGQKNEQLKNAQFLEKLGMAIVCQQEETTSVDLTSVLDTMIKDYDEFKKAAEKGKSLVKKDAAERIITELNNVEKAKTTQKGQTNP